MSGRFGKYPAFVSSYDADKRQCRVNIPGITDGAEVMPLAEICYPIGDKSEYTEILIQEGDRIWVEFERGDERYPIIVGWRCKNVGNDKDWRRWLHANVEITADNQLHLKCKAFKVDADDSIEMNTKDATVNATTTTIASTESVDLTTGKLDVTAPEGTTLATPLLEVSGDILDNAG